MALKKIKSVRTEVRFYDGSTANFDAFPDNTFTNFNLDAPVEPLPVRQWITVEMTQEEEEPQVGLMTPDRYPRREKLYVVIIKSKFLRAIGIENFRDNAE